MNESDRICINDCRTALHAADWVTDEWRVLLRGERAWQVEASRGNHWILSRARDRAVAWQATYQQATNMDEE